MGGAEHGRGVPGGAEPDWAGHEARAGDLAVVPPYDQLRGSAGRAALETWRKRVRDAPADVAASLVLLLIRDTPAYTGRADTGHYLMSCLEHVLGRRRLVVPAADAAWAARAAAGLPGTYASRAVLGAAAALAVWCDPPGDPGLLDAAEALVPIVDAHGVMLARDRARIRKRLVSLRPGVPAGGPLDTTMISPDDGWSAVVLEEAARWPGDPAGANLLLRHLVAAAGSKPSRKWQERAVALLRDPGAAQLLRMLVESIGAAQPTVVRLRYGELPVLISAPNTDLVRAACWAAGALAADWAVPALRAAAERSAGGFLGFPASAKVPNACVYGLGLIGSEPALAALLDLRRRVKHAGFRTQIRAALAVAAAGAGLAVGELAERFVPDAGLDGHGERQITVGETVARVSVGHGSAGHGWRVRTEWLKTTDRSDQISADAARQVKAAVKEVRTALAGERSRLEGLLAEERSWAVADWRRLYLDHPVTGAVARGLIWSFSTGVTGIPAGGGRLEGADGPHAIPAEATVGLWHPARAGTGQVGRWRDYLVAAGRAQPFKQAFREVYLITPAELETRLYSNRFAAHALRYQQAYALFKERGWAANYLGPYDGGHEGQARRDFPLAGLTAFFDHYPADEGPFAYPVSLCTTGRVGFCRTGDRRRALVPLDEVPDLVFCEAMRDVDLFVSAASIALDGDLTETAVIRREALARVVPKLKIAPRLELAGRYLRVRGRLNTYKIHIGSGNVLIEPDDRYLCIVPASGRAKVMLPFDGDQVLSIVLSKAVLLAADDQITDPAITSQLRAR